ncbi:MAG: acyl--CoA ligase [Gemmataceae bacterium]|nr:acyl--CoA ligase [Gemmataceae bacterium]
MTTAATLADLLARHTPSQPAVILPDDGSTTTHAGLHEQVEALATRLCQTTLQPGQVVALVLPNGLEYLATFLAVTRARLVAAPLNSAYTPDEFRFYLEDAGARAVIVPPGPHPAREVASALGLPLWSAQRDSHGRVTLDGEGLSDTAGSTPEEPRPDDVALFLHTSGTTSRPKGVPLTHGNLMASVRNIAGHYRLSPEDIGLVVMPLFHVHGLIGATLAPLHAGGTVVVPPRFSAGAFWPAAQAHRVTWYSAAPTIHQILLSRADSDAPKAPGFRFIRSCSAALAGVTLAGLEARFNAPVLEAYAMTEAAHQMTSNPLPPAARKPGAVGRGTNVDVAIMDESGTLLPAGIPGEVVIRGPNVTRGYHNNPEANATSFTNGWFRTGDRGVLDSDSYLTLIGRIKELINRGGEKISPLEVDAVLLAHPAVAEAATFGAPDAKYGEEVHAAVVLKGEASVEQLQAFCQERLASFKVPKVIHVTREMPRTATGKIQRRHVAAAFLKNP